jgi:hypothetical protein
MLSIDTGRLNGSKSWVHKMISNKLVEAVVALRGYHVLEKPYLQSPIADLVDRYRYGPSVLGKAHFGPIVQKGMALRGYHVLGKPHSRSVVEVAVSYLVVQPR